MDSLDTRIQRYTNEVRPWFANQVVDVLVCRTWSITDSFNSHMGKGYIFSDGEGYVIQGEARCSILNCLVCTLEEGCVYKLQNFKLLPNASSCCFNKYATICLQLDPITSVTQVTCSLNGFVRHPFHPIALEDVFFNESKYLIDVVGVVVRFGASSRQAARSFTVDCQIISARGYAMRMTLLNSASASISREQPTNTPGNIFILTSMDIREFGGELYLSSTQATTIHNCESFPAERDKFIRTIEYAHPGLTTEAVPPPTPGDHALSRLLYFGRATTGNGMEVSMTLKCKVTVIGIKMLESWIRPNCQVDTCQYSVVPAESGFWCDSCQQLSKYAPPGYNLHLDVTDGISVVTVKFTNTVAERMLNKRATTLIAELGDALDGYAAPTIILGLCGSKHTLRLNTNSYRRFDTHESFTCRSITRTHN